MTFTEPTADPTATYVRAGAPHSPGVLLRLKHRLGLLDRLRVVPYLGIGTRHSLQLSGRVLEARGLVDEIDTDDDDESLLVRAWRTLERLESDEIPGATLRASFRDQTHVIFTDNEGFFRVTLPVDEPLEPGWHEVRFEIVDAVDPNADASAIGRALVPSDAAEFAVISDLDDTVLWSAATDKLEQARLTLTKNAASRTPFPGVGALYRALANGSDRPMNPLFYLSRSGWNLYDLFMAFFEAHDIPQAPMFLRDLRWREAPSLTQAATHHKLARIRSLLETYPRMPFVLIGDSGQGDLRKYRQAVLECPGRVRAVFIRDIGVRPRDGLMPMVHDLRERGVAAHLADDTQTMAMQMAEHGLFDDATAQRVIAAAAAAVTPDGG